METSNIINSVKLNAGTNFPYLAVDVVNDNSYPKNPGFQTVHWHEDIQFIYVFSGSFCRATSFYPYPPKRIKLFRKML